MEKFHYQKPLGEGGFAQVFLATNAKGEKFAVKKIPRKGDNFMTRLREVAANARLNHPNIVRYHDHYETPDYCFVLFEYVNGIDLFQFLESSGFTPMNENTARNLFKQILSAVKYAHKCGVFHRDIKLENILITPSSKVKLIDFGLCAVNMDPTTLKDAVGSSDYCAPELLKRQIYRGELADIFSMGVIFYCVLTGELPFDSADRLQFFLGKAPHPELDFRYNPSDDAKDMLAGMLLVDPLKRFTIKDLCRHKWMNSTIKSKDNIFVQ